MAVFQNGDEWTTARVYLIFLVSDVMLILERRLFLTLIPQRQNILIVQIH